MGQRFKNNESPGLKDWEGDRADYPLKKIRDAFHRQRGHAKERGVSWELTLWQWWSIWQQSGHLAQRGPGQGYVMCRKGDVGPYVVGNVFIATSRENSSAHPNKKSDLPMGVRKGHFSKNFTAKRSINGKITHIGSFTTPNLAHAAYLSFGEGEQS